MSGDLKTSTGDEFNCWEFLRDCSTDGRGREKMKLWFCLQPVARLCVNHICFLFICIWLSILICLLIICKFFPISDFLYLRTGSHSVMPCWGSLTQCSRKRRRRKIWQIVKNALIDKIWLVAMTYHDIMTLARSVLIWHHHYGNLHHPCAKQSIGVKQCN